MCQRLFCTLVWPIKTRSSLDDGEKRNRKIVIGTRSAIFTPLLNPGIIILDEEHDTSFKQQSGFRYSARDLAVMRGQFENIPVVLGSATPSLESLYNVERRRYQLLSLPGRAGKAKLPSLTIVDLRQKKLIAGMSEDLLISIENTLKIKVKYYYF